MIQVMLGCARRSGEHLGSPKSGGKVGGITGHDSVECQVSSRRLAELSRDIGVWGVRPAKLSWG